MIEGRAKIIDRETSTKMIFSSQWQAHGLPKILKKTRPLPLKNYEKKE
jgi:hypothetical protein